MPACGGGSTSGGGSNDSDSGISGSGGSGTGGSGAGAGVGGSATGGSGGSQTGGGGGDSGAGAGGSGGLVDSGPDGAPQAGAGGSAGDAGPATCPATCDDGDPCNGIETCDESTGQCTTGSPTCNDGIACTTDTCDPVTGACTFTPDNTLCGDGEVCASGCVVLDCQADDDCSDNLFCNGIETCDLATNTCVPGTPYVCDDGLRCSVDACVETAMGAACQATPGDYDGDQALDENCVPDQGTDCDDNATWRNPDAPELCNGIDDNCDGQTDEGLGVGDPCSDGLGACAAEGIIECNGAGEAVCNAVAGAPTTELCGDFIDNDCDGEIDDGFRTLNNACTAGTGACETQGTYVCSPDKLSIACFASSQNGGTELCGDGIDNDCNGTADDGFDVGAVCTVGVGACATDGQKICSNDGLGTVCDAEAGAPGTETCNDIDDDCNGVVDEGCDDDGDDYCDFNKVTVGTPAACPNGGDDCNDNHPAVHPSADEACDGMNNDCAAGVDDGCDDDGDDYCDSTRAIVGTPGICPNGGGDCDDLEEYVHPDVTELCDDIDNNCTGGIDDGCDDDNDGYCDFNRTTINTPATCPNGGADCNDNMGSINPGAAEICDQLNNNCTGGVDEVCNKAFITSTTYLPTEVAFADDACQARANAASLAGTFKAYVSYNTAHAKSRFGSARGWIRMDGKPVADTMDDLASGRMFYPLRINELKQDDATGVGAWTGTTSTGENNFSTNCSNWGVNSGLGTIGYSDATSTLFQNGTNASCNIARPIYCLQTDFTTEAVVPAPPQSMKRAFVTVGTWQGGSGRPSADALCQSEAQTAGLTGTYYALLSATDETAVARFADSTSTGWARPDGVIVASTRAAFFTDSNWAAPLNQLADGSTSYLGAVAVWTGFTSFNLEPTPAQACSGWTTTEGTGRRGSAARTSPKRFDDAGASCTSTARLYCLQH